LRDFEQRTGRIQRQGFRGTLDAHIVALDQKNRQAGMEEQESQTGKKGFSITGAPMVANGVLITGISGAEFGIRGFLDGLDPETGKQLWRHYTIPAPVRRAPRHGRQATLICAAAALHGSPAHTILSSISCIGALVMPAHGRRADGWATIFTPHRCLR
jgi:hypothetical protein